MVRSYGLFIQYTTLCFLIILNDISTLLFFSKKKHVQVCVEVTWTAVVGVKNASEDFFLIR